MFEIKSLNFDYYYGSEAEQFTFYRIPKVLMTAPHFKRLSSDAKILYGLMLDRMSLSMKNGWIDDENKVYVIPEKLTHTQLIYRLDISTRHYYRLRQQAMNILSIRLWASPSADIDSWLDVLTLLENIK